MTFVLAVDDDGRLLAVEVKPANAIAGIAKSPAQVALYATLWSTWLDETDDSVQVLQGMLDQRARLGRRCDGGAGGAVGIEYPLREFAVEHTKDDQIARFLGAVFFEREALALDELSAERLFIDRAYFERAIVRPRPVRAPFTAD